MSLINDALSKVERDRAAQRLAAYPGAPTGRGAKRRPSAKSGASRLVLLNVAVLAALSVVAVAVFLRNPSPHNAESAAPDFAVTTPLEPEPIAAAAAPADAPTTASSDAPRAVAGDSPFAAPVTDADLTEPPPASDYELAGMTAVGDNTLISVMRRSDQRSVWVPVGKSVGEITAVSYNALSDEAVIRVRGQLLTVGMRSGPIESSEPAEPAPDPAAQTAE
jgi:hypothetical protein